MVVFGRRACSGLPFLIVRPFCILCVCYLVVWGFLVSWFLGFLVSWFLAFLVSGMLGFRGLVFVGYGDFMYSANSSDMATNTSQLALLTIVQKYRNEKLAFTICCYVLQFVAYFAIVNSPKEALELLYDDGHEVWKRLLRA